MADKQVKFKMTDLNFRKNVDPEKRRNANKSIIELNELKSEYRKRKDDAESLTKLLQSEKEKLKEITAQVEEARNKLSAAQEEIDADYLPEGAQPRARIQARDVILAQVSQAETSLMAQRSCTAKVSEDVLEAERKLFEADRNINRFAETLEDTMLAIATIKELDKEKALKLSNMEEETQKRKIADKKAADEALELQEKELNAFKAKQAKISRHLQTEAKNNLSQSHKKTRETTAKIKELHDLKQQDRTEAVLELKTNQNAVRAEVASLADKHVKKVLAAKQKLEDEKDAMLAKGLNPYVEFRKKEVEDEAERREKRLRDAVEKNKEELAIRLKKEEQFFDKQQQAERAAKEYEMKFRESQGRGLIEEKNSNYITKRTSAHVEVLDPTGRAARVDPSQVTDIPDYSFGLGKSSRIPASNMKKITEQVRESLKVDKDELGEYRRLVTGVLKKAGITDDEKDSEKRIKKSISFDEPVKLKDMTSLEGLASPPGAMPGIDLSATAVNFAGNELEKSSLLKIAVEEDGDMYDPSGGIASAKKSKYPTVQLSKFERDALDRAKGRHRTRIEFGTEQIAGGRQFKGQAFVSKPVELVFKDFEVGKKYRKMFTMTNVSYTFNSFKLLDLDDEVIDFFVITFEKPGRMSAGVSCSIEIVFTPQINKDILTAIRLLTETGPVEVPLKCLIKRCAPRIVQPVIDFGRIIVGQKLSNSLKIKNSQALSTEFIILPFEENKLEVATGDDSIEQNVIKSDGSEEYVPETFDPTMDPALNESELLYRVQRVMTQTFRKMKFFNPLPLSASLEIGNLDGYGATSLDIICAPLTVGLIEQKFSVKFNEVEDSAMTVDDLGEPVMKEQFVTVTVIGEEVPIYVAEETMDLKCTLYDRIYRKKITLKNRAKQAYKVSITVAAAYAKYVEVNPTILFVQAKSSQNVNVKFTPAVDMLSKVGYFTCPYEAYTDAALTVIPVEIRVAGQDLPVFFMVRSSVCPSTVELSSSSLEFGRVYVGQQSSKTITLCNRSMLPQKVAFVRLKKEFSVKPNDGFAVLLPNESMDFEIFFSPISAINYEVDITLITSLNDSYVLKVIAEGVDPPLEFSSSVIRMRTTSPGERVVESVLVTNKTSHSQCFEVVSPNSRFTWLKVSPAVVQLEPGKSGRLEFEYCAPENAFDLDPNIWHEETIKTGNEAMNESPFDEWSSELGWVVGKGMYGELQWFKPPPQHIRRKNAVTESDIGEVMDNMSKSDESQETLSLGNDVNNGGNDNYAVTDSTTTGTEESLGELSFEEWGVIGKWALPIILKSKKKSLSSTAILNTTSTSASTARGQTVPAPLFITIQTAVNLPQIEADIKSIDFGQISVGTRILKSFKIINRNFQPILLKSVGLNAIGPFTLLRPIKVIGSRDTFTVIVECLPLSPGLIVEVLEISAVDESLMGHRLRVTLRVQGLKPSISLEKLSPPPPNWSSTCGILDFGNCLMLDNNITKKFTIHNKSTFTIDASIIRVVSNNLSPGQQADFIERTASGLPIFSFRPERLQILQGTSAEIEVIFRPDRGRFLPFREDLDIFIGKTDEVYRVGVLGRAWSRQYFVTPGDPRDEPFTYSIFKGIASVEDTLLVHSSAVIRTAAKEARKVIDLSFPESPNILLKFPDPFDPNANPSTYVEIAAAPAAPTGKGPAKGAPPAPVAAPGSRQQTKRLYFNSTKVSDNRAGVTPGSFEVILSQEAKESGLWSLSVDKGSLTAASVDAAAVAVDVTCTLPKPRSLGGVVVGSWKAFQVEVVLKGGWCLPGESDEHRMWIT
eukprot:CAMPEP_0170113434 /NCGR_PEP_ID=MMETSP0020_2-20130122/9888_1 /TAXON_ID=98059 /ORGANISM="Dinobryon sp., Strain UTEXLB2267" /LENGTH=1783 /DNA_ID=CAMNT_0010339793 /DNA_START=13 /DNA_END=5360 /DNA_ORIENTATION=-